VSPGALDSPENRATSTVHALENDAPERRRLAALSSDKSLAIVGDEVRVRELRSSAGSKRRAFTSFADSAQRAFVRPNERLLKERLLKGVGVGNANAVLPSLETALGSEYTPTCAAQTGTRRLPAIAEVGSHALQVVALTCVLNLAELHASHCRSVVGALFTPTALPSRP
jgi:hypothetical protein